MNDQIEAGLYIEELKSQRNVIADQLALAGARIVKLTKELEDAKALIDTLQNKG